jgi:starch-binding outer membrane protein, SusD/RagB family
MKLFKYSYLVLAVAAITSCTKDLDRVPETGTTSVSVYSTPAGYKQALAKVYAHFALTSSSGPNNSDIRGIDAGTSSYIRMYWKLQELTTDEAVCGWNDPGLPELHFMSWGSNNVIIKGFYARLFSQITVANEFMRESDPSKVSAKGFSAADVNEIKAYRAEARMIRAYDYLVALDLFGSAPYLTEANLIGGDNPTQIKRHELFKFVESELQAAEADLKAPRTNEYGRFDKAAAWMSLARLYLNAKVYNDTARFTDAITQSRKVINAGYSLHTPYKDLFNANNNKRTDEIIFAIPFDGQRMQSWGGTTFLVHASIGGSMSPSNYGVDFGWGGLRTTKQFSDLFPDPSGATDKRAMFWTAGQNKDVMDISTFNDGYATYKWQNKTDSGANGSNPTFVDTDFPLFRLAEAYLIFSEAVMQGGSGGTQAEALTYFNALRQRAYGNTSGNVSSLTTDLILDERGRELYWEGFRRSDLIRYNKFTEATYLWQWKGGVQAGRGVESFRKVFPIPASEIQANPNLAQNTGY